MVTIEKSIQKLLSDYIHSTKTAELYERLEALIPKWSRSKIVTPSTINPIRTLARVHGLPRSFQDLFFTPLWEKSRSTDPEKLKFAIKLIHCIKYALKYDKSFTDIQSLLSMLKSSLKLEDFRRFSEPLCKELLSQFLVTISSILSPEQVEREKCDKAELHQLQKYVPYVEGKNRSLIQADLERAGYWSSVNNNVRTSSGTSSPGGNTTGLNVREGEALIASFHQKSIASKSGGRITADAVKTQQTLAITTEENVSEKTHLQNISLANALNESRAKSRTEQKSFEPLILPAKEREGGSDRFWARTTGGEIVQFLVSAHTGRHIKDKDIVYLRKKFNEGHGYTVPLSNEVMNMIAEIFALISKYQFMDTKLGKTVEAKGTTSALLLEGALREVMDKPEWTNCRIHILNAVEYDCIRNEVVPDMVKELLLKLRQSTACTEEIKNIIWGILSSDDEHCDQNFSEALVNVESVEQCSRSLEFVRKNTISRQTCSNVLEKFPTVFNVLLSVITGVTFSIEQKRVAAEAIENILGFEFAPKPTPSQLESLVQYSSNIDQNTRTASIVDAIYIKLQNEEKGRREARATNLLKTSVLRKLALPSISGVLNVFHQKGWVSTNPVRFTTSVPQESVLNFKALSREALEDDVKKALLGSVSVSSNILTEYEILTGAILRCIVTSLGKSESAPETFNQVSEDVWKHLVTAGLHHSDPIIPIVVLASMAKWVSLPSISDIIVKRHVNQEILARKLSSRAIIYTDGRITLEEDLPHDFDFQDVENDSDEEGKRKFTCVSEIVARIMIACAHSQKMAPEASLPSVSEALCTNQDKATEILCSEYLFLATRLGQNLPPLVQNHLLEMTRDSVGDVKVYSKAAYCTNLGNLYGKSSSANNGESEEKISTLVELYSLKRTMLGEEDFTEWTNVQILKAFSGYSVHFRLPETAFQVLTLALNSASTESDGPDNHHQIIQIILDTLKRSAGLTKAAVIKNSIPNHCIEAVEKVLLSKVEFKETCASVLEPCLLAGRWVSEAVLEEFTKYLHHPHPSDGSIPYIQRLCMANENQELPDRIFEEMVVALLGLRLHEAAGAPASLLQIKAFSWVGDALPLLSCLREYLSRGRALSPVTMEGIAKILQKGLHTQELVRCLTLASSNDQSLSKEVVELALNNRDGELDPSLKAELAMALVRRNQDLPWGYRSSVFAAVEDCRDNQMPEASLLSIMIQRNHGIPMPVVKAFAHFVHRIINEPHFSPEFVLALIRVLETQSPDEELNETIKSIFKRMSQGSVLAQQTLAGIGLQKLFPTDVPKQSEGTPADLGHALPTDTDFFQKLISQIRRAYQDSMGEATGMSIPNKRLLGALLAVDEKSIARVSAELLHVFMPGRQCLIFGDVSDVVGQVLCETRDPRIIQTCQAALDKWVGAGILLGSSCCEMLNTVTSPLGQKLWRRDLLDRDKSNRIGELSGTSFGNELIRATNNYVKSRAIGPLEVLVSSSEIQNPENRLYVHEMVRILATEEEETTWTGIPHIAQAVSIYIMESGPGQVPQELLEECIEGKSGIVLPVVKAYLIGIRDKKIIPNSERTLMTIATSYLDDLPWQMRVETLKCLTRTSFSEDVVRIFLDSLKSGYAPVRSIAFTLISANRDSISKVRELEEKLSGLTKDVLDKTYAIIYDGPTTSVDPVFDQGLLLTLHSLSHWDLRRLKEVSDPSQWFRLLSISDFLTRLSTSLNDTVELVKSASNMFDICKQDPLIFASLTELLCRTKSKYLLGILQKLTYNEIINLLRVDESIWSQEVLQFGLSKLLRQKIERNMSVELSTCMSKKLVRILVSPQLALDLVSKFAALENSLDLEELVEFLEREKGADQRKMIASLQEALKIVGGGASSALDLRNHMEKTLFLSHVPSQGCYKVEIEELLETLFKRGFKLDQLRRRLLLVRSPAHEMGDDVLDGARVKGIYQVLYQLAEYGVEPKVLPEIIENIKELECHLWGAETSKIILRSVFCRSGGEKTVEEVVAEFGDLNSLPTEGITSVIESVRSEDSSTSSWTRADIKNWALRFKEREQPELDEFVLVEVLAVAKRAFQLHSGFRLTPIQTLACYTALKPSSGVGKGMLQQVVTGSGKSTIIAIIALVKALLGTKVDVYTSSPVLAQRDSEEWSGFYELFGLTCDHNADTGSGYTRGEKTCYKKDIVYGETSQFQFDTLRDEYSGLGTRAGRGYGFAIVDEVDSMLIDDSSKLARLSSTIAGMDLVQTLYHLAWHRLMDIQNRVLAIGDSMFYLAGKRSGATYHYADENENIIRINNVIIYISQNERNIPALQKAKIQPIDDIETFVQSLMTDYLTCLIGNIEEDPAEEAPVHLPPNLRVFAHSQINNWVQSALTALTFQENVHYIVDEGLIKPVDFSTTGIVQASTNWNNGMHQFLQIKHSLRMTTETVATNFLSNMAMFGKYGHHLLGLTGTLGSESGKSILKQVYNIQTVMIPELYFKRFLKLVDHVVPTEELWLSKVVASCLIETSKRRAVLVICQTIKQSKLLEAELLKHSRELTVKLYFRNDENQERHVERIRPGDVIVATTLASRGTDIKTPDIEEYGGLHVILTFLPESLRVEEQALGRTSRQGSQGTGQLIVRDMESTAIAELIQRRDEGEKAKLEEFSKKQLPSIQVKDQLFQKFSKVFLEIRNHLVENPIHCSKVKVGVKKLVGKETLTTLEHIVLQAVEERWALFLKRVDDEQLSADIARQEYATFEADIQRDKLSFETLTSSTKNPFYWIQFANEHFRRKTPPGECARYYQNAIDIDSRSSAGAIAGKANLLLRGESCWYQLTNDYETNYKLEAIPIYREAIKLLYQDIGALASVQTLLSQRTQSTASELFLQLTTKINLLGTYARKLESNIATVEKSLRQVYSCGTSEGENTQNTVVVPGKSIPNSGYLDYALMFHDLTKKNDMDLSLLNSSSDQAVNTINNNLSYLFNNIRIRLESQNLNKVLTAVPEICKDIPIEMELLSLPDFKSCIDVITKLELRSFKLGIYGNIESVQACCQTSFPDCALQEVAIKCQDSSSDHFCSWRKTIPIDPNAKDVCELKKHVPAHVKRIHLVLNISEDGAMEALGRLQINCKDNEDRLAFSLTASGISPENIIERWEDCLQNFNNNALSFMYMNKSEAIPIIQALRKECVEFTLEFTDLNLEGAQSTLDHADREEEHIKVSAQKEMQNELRSDLLPIGELRELSQRGLGLLVSFAEKNFVPWKSVIGMGLIATTQIAVGSVLVATGFGATVGMGLVTEGFADFTTAGTAYASRNLDWSSYAKQKAVSLTISAATMGWGKLNNGAKGAQSLLQGASTEAVEQAGTKLMAKTGTAAQNIVTTSKNLKSLALKNVAVTAGENIDWAGINFIIDSVAQFSFEQIKDVLTERVDKDIQVGFLGRDFRHYLSRLYALDSVLSRAQLLFQLLKWFRATTNPESEKWTSLWNSIGVPLTRGILSDPKYLESTFSMAARAHGLLNGMAEITSLVSKVCKHLESKIKTEEESTISPAQIIRRNFNHLTLNDAETVASCIRFVSFDLTFQALEFPSDSILSSKVESMKGNASKLERVFQELYERELSFDKDIECNSKLRKAITDAITTHIIHTANAQLVSPGTTYAVGSIVANISHQLQANYLLSEEDLSPEQLQDLGKVEELTRKDPLQLTPEEREFLARQERQAHTAKGSIEANDRDPNFAYQQREILAKAEVIARSKANNTEEKVAEGVVQAAKGIAVDDPADISIIFLLGKANGLNLKIVHEPDYVPSDQDIVDRVQIVVYIKGEVGSPGGHYHLKNPTTGELIKLSSDVSNCGFAVLGKLTGKPVEELRILAASFILSNLKECADIRESKDWMIRVRPESANELLGVDEAKRGQCPNCGLNHGSWLAFGSHPQLNCVDCDIPDATPEQIELGLRNPVFSRDPGPNNRTERLVSIIRPEHLGTGTKANEATRKYAKSLAPGKKVQAGHILGSPFGGNGRDTRNIVPQAPNFDQERYSQMERRVENWIVKNKSLVLLEVTFEYADDSSSIPTRTTYKYWSIKQDLTWECYEQTFDNERNSEDIFSDDETVSEDFSEQEDV